MSTSLNNTILEVLNLKKYFGGIKAVDNVSFSVMRGEIVGLIGPNGSGKTTTINLITGFLKPDSGKIIYEGENITGKSPHVIARKGIARTFQITRPFRELSVLSNVMLGALTIYPNLEQAKSRAIEVLKTLNIYDRKDVNCGDLSLPDQRKIELARALAMKPTLLLLDEVLAGLTIDEAEHILDLLRELNKQGVTMLIVEHRVRLVSKLVNRFIVLSEGKLIAEGTPSKVLNNPVVIKIYLGDKYSAQRTDLNLKVI
ncbi:MAG: ABC transporter ATP-binding protein [Desulfurococcaceae archaeon]